MNRMVVSRMQLQATTYKCATSCSLYILLVDTPRSQLAPCDNDNTSLDLADLNTNRYNPYETPNNCVFQIWADSLQELGRYSLCILTQSVFGSAPNHIVRVVFTFIVQINPGRTRRRETVRMLYTCQFFSKPPPSFMFHTGTIF